VFLSVFVHGISVAPLADWYGKYIAALDKRNTASAEAASVPEMPTRRTGFPAKSTSIIH
jgi:hypothetical protein